MSKTKATGLVFALILLAGSIASAGQKIITYDSSVSKLERTGEIEKMGGKVIKDLRLINALVAVFPDDQKDLSLSFRAAKGVIRVEDDLYQKWIERTPAPLPLSYVSDGLSAIRDGQAEDPGSSPAPTVAPQITSYETEIPWGVKRVNAAGAWGFNTGKGVKVAIIDTGMDYTHPDLAAHYAGGYNFVANTENPFDDNGHGTHVSGTIGAIRDANGAVGVAPDAQLYAVKVLDSQGSGTFSDIIAGIQWAVDNNIQVINMSLGASSGTSALASAITAASKAGVTIVCAAGNSSGAVGYPAKYPEAIAVSASDSADRIASFSCRGPEIDFIAPGVNIYSTSYQNGGYTSMSGTSMASPHVAGLAALAVASGADSPAKVKAALSNAAYSIGLSYAEQGSGMIDASKIGALLMAGTNNTSAF